MGEKSFKPYSGYMLLLVFFLMVTGGIVLIANAGQTGWGIVLFVLSIILLPGFFIVYPNGSKVLTLFGKYKGTVKANGFFWANPFFLKQSISLRARNFDSEKIKVNDKRGNPIMISVILVWRVKDTFKAAFEVDHYEHFVRVQSDAAVRKMAGIFSYDNFDDDLEEITLRSGVNEVNDALEEELSERLAIAGIEVLEARIGYLAYASEIASAMLKRQQAEAIVAARFKIVEGAIWMVEDALEKLADNTDIDLTTDQRAAMVSNLMVVLCSDRDATPVINTGTLNQ